MQIVIDITEKTYNDICRYGLYLNPNSYENLEKALKKGTPLPKGHGRLIDASNLLTVTDIREDGTELTYVPYEEIENAQTIIKADTESEGKE